MIVKSVYIPATGQSIEVRKEGNKARLTIKIAEFETSINLEKSEAIELSIILNEVIEQIN